MADRLGVLTSGGDAPGMNAAIRAVVRTAAQDGREVVGFRRGFCGLIDDDAIPLSPRSVANILQRGGSILDTARDTRFHDEEVQRSACEVLARLCCRALIAIGGEGTQTGAASLQELWDGAVLGVASTIDNDLGGTDQSIGFDTACNTALEAIDRIRDTANALDRLFFIEVMGRHRGFIALEVALAGGAEAVVLPEVGLDPDALLGLIEDNYARGKLSCIVVVAEGAHPGGARGLLQELDERSSGLRRLPGADPRVTILGHIQRGGNPSVSDRVLASRVAAAATRAAIAGQRDRLFGVRGREICSTPIAEALAEKKAIDRSILELVNSLAG